jgi:hypothetical protein
MVGPCGALPVGPTASTTEFEDDVDGGPPGGRYQQIRQRPPQSFEDDVDGGPLGALSVGPAASTTEVQGDIDGGAPGDAAGGSGSIRH